MINIPITKILFLDIETVGGCKDYQTCIQSNPKVANQFDKYFDWFLKRFPEDKELKEPRNVREVLWEQSQKFKQAVALQGDQQALTEVQKDTGQINRDGEKDSAPTEKTKRKKKVKKEIK